MKLTGVQPLSGDKYRLSFDGAETLIVSADIAVGLIGGERGVSDEEYAEWRAAADSLHCRERAMRILSATPMSERGLYDRLVEKGEPERAAAETVAWLVSIGFLNDETYAAMLVRHCAAKGYGARRVRDELYRRKVPREVWDAAMDEMPQQDETIDRLLRSKLRSAEPDRAELKRATDALARRGFSWEEIRAALERLRDEE